MMADNELMGFFAATPSANTYFSPNELIAKLRPAHFWLYFGKICLFFFLK